MKRCSSLDHPHCTAWVMPGDAACGHGHAQPATAADTLGSSFGILNAARSMRAAGLHRDPAEPIRPKPPAQAQIGERAHLHVSGFDPRAAGGRQAIRLELRGMPPDAPARMTMLLNSSLLPGGASRLECTRGLRGEWRPAFVEFSSRGREHGQYRIDVELHAREAGDASRSRTWTATLVLLVPRADASLAEIHQTFLSTHKNVRIHADDASIARLQGLESSGSMDIDIDARNASIAQIQLGPAGNAAPGRIDVALPTIAWDEDLIEIDVPAVRAAHPCPASGACLVYAEPEPGQQRHLRLFALDEWVLGRFEAVEPHAEADVLLCHHGEHGPDAQGLTRRLSARHAVIRPARGGFEIEDVSRYGLLLDGVWPGKHSPVALRPGMRIELTASIKGVAVLVVTSLQPHAVVLHRIDAGGAAECIMLLAPDVEPARAASQDARFGALPRAAGLPLLFHRDGGFWHRDPATGADTPLSPATLLDRLAGIHGRVRFTAGPYPEHWVARARRGDRRRVHLQSTGA